MSKYASKVVSQALEWLGKNEKDGSHKSIIDIYNAHTPLARGYKVKYTDAWCATFVSAVAVKLGYTDIIPTECSCNEMIKLFKKIGAWVEDDSVKPNPGDIIFYDWEDNGVGENVGSANHTGIVEKVVGDTITVIEGNYSNAVKRRTLKVNGKYIRGYGMPKYDAEPTKPVEPTKVTKVTATDGSQNFLKSLAGTYKVTANSGLNVRHGACVTKKKMVAIPKNTSVQCYGYYTNCLGTKWLYIQFAYKGILYTGFASSKYLKKV